MTKYLIRRTNRWGRWVHMETVDYPPSREHIETTYGPGEYSVMVAEEGVRGLQGYANYSIPYSIEIVGWSSDKPTVEYVQQKYGEGNYFIAGNATDIKPMIISRDEKKDEMVEDLMWQGIQVMRRVYVIIKLTGLPYRSTM